MEVRNSNKIHCKSYAFDGMEHYKFKYQILKCSRKSIQNPLENELFIRFTHLIL